MVGGGITTIFLSAFAIKRSVRVGNTVLFRFTFAFCSIAAFAAIVPFFVGGPLTVTALRLLDEASVTFYRVADRMVQGLAQNTTSVRVLELPGLH
jgi:hypothetical protein